LLLQQEAVNEKKQEVKKSMLERCSFTLKTTRLMLFEVVIAFVVAGIAYYFYHSYSSWDKSMYSNFKQVSPPANGEIAFNYINAKTYVNRFMFSEHDYRRLIDSLIRSGLPNKFEESIIRSEFADNDEHMAGFEWDNTTEGKGRLYTTSWVKRNIGFGKSGLALAFSVMDFEIASRQMLVTDKTSWFWLYSTSTSRVHEWKAPVSAGEYANLLQWTDYCVQLNMKTYMERYVTDTRILQSEIETNLSNFKTIKH